MVERRCNSRQTRDIAPRTQRHEPCSTCPGEVSSMETFFVRKQIIAGAILFACVELVVLLVRVLR